MRVDCFLEPSQSEILMKAIGFSPNTSGRQSARLRRLEARAKSIEGRATEEAFEWRLADMFEDGQVGEAQQIL